MIFNKKLKEKMQELEKENNELLENMELLLNKDEALMNENNTLSKQLELAIKSINNISGDIYQFKEYSNKLKDSNSGYIVDHDAILNLISAADQMLERFDVFYTSNATAELESQSYPDKPLELIIKKYANPNNPYEEFEEEKDELIEEEKSK